MLLAFAGLTTLHSCSGGGTEQLRAETQLAIERNDYEQALTLVRKARKLSASSGYEADRLRLLEAEVLIYSQIEDQGLALAAPLLTGESAVKLAPRQAMLTGVVLRRKNRWDEAKAKQEWARRAAREAGDKRTEAMAGVHLCNGFTMRKEWELAQTAIQAAAAVAASAGDPYALSLARFGQAFLLMERGESDQSLEIFRTVAEEARRTNNIPRLVKALDNMALNYDRVGDYERALDYNGRAMKLFDQRDTPDTKMILLGSRGQLLLKLERPSEAAVELEKALALAKRRGIRERIRDWSDLLTQAKLKLGRLDEAERLTAGALELAPDWPDALKSRGLIFERRGKPELARRDWEAVLADPKSRNEVRWDAQFGLARLHAAANERGPAIRRYEAALKVLNDAWRSLRTDDSRLTFPAQAAEIYHSYVGALVGWGEERQALQVEESSRAWLLGDHGGQRETPATPEALVRLADRTGSVFLAYWIAPGGAGGSHVRVIGGGRSDRVPLKISDARELSRLVDEHNDLMTQQLLDPREHGKAAAALYDLLVQPVAGRVPPGSHVALIPDGALHRLNFETLVRAKNGRPGFWIEDVTLQTAPSLSLLFEQPATQRGAGQKMLSIGDALPAPDFARLDHAASEMKIVKAAFLQTTEFSGATAKPSSFQAADPGAYTHIHFTAHAEANRESPLDSAVILSPEALPTGGLRYRLLAREVAALKLRADMVTVSACRSAGNRTVQGEGMVGFAWAFLRAGANNVVAGLWDVGDRATGPLMEEMYKSVRQGLPATESLRAAKLSFIAQGRNSAKPYNWAPFQVYSRSLRRR